MMRLRFLADVNPGTPQFDSLPDDAEVTFVPLGAVWPGARWDPSGRRPKNEVASGYTRFREDDILVPKITPTFQAGRSLIAKGLGGVAAGTTELHVVRPHEGVDTRYINYLFLGKPFLAGGAARMIGVAGQKRVPESWLADFPVPVEAPAAQREIADFLDIETARIDALIERKRHLVMLAEERFFAGISKTLIPPNVPYAALARFASIQTGLTVDGARVANHESVTRPYLRVANVQPGHLELDSVVDVTVPRGLAERATLRVGDVLMTEGGDLDKLGRGTVWRGEINDCLHQNHVFAVRPNPQVLTPDFLALVTQTSHARAHFERTGVKTTNLASTSSAKVMELPIPVLSLERQQELIEAARSATRSRDGLIDRLARQIGLLREHRQALITAAVTGQLVIEKAAA